MDTIPASDPMENPPHTPLGGLDPANLLKQGAADDTIMDGMASSFHPPSIEELAAIFPQFEILGLIGQGGMGAVYKVRQTDLDRIVALKILPPVIGQSPEFSNRFTREAKALAKFNHPGIVTIHEFGQQAGLHFILMEFVDGVNLAQLMKTGRISPRKALAIVPQICDALQFAHDQGIVHRDIKPENILLDRLGRVKVADFGIAKLAGEVTQAFLPDLPASAASMLTEAGKIIGTPVYMAPEQITHPSEVDHRADIYALGVVFYQMLTGELPGKRLEAPSKKVYIDVRLDEIVLKAMEKDPELRYQQASVMRTRVEDLSVESSTAKSPGKRKDLPSEQGTDPFAIISFTLAIVSFLILAMVVLTMMLAGLIIWPLGFLPAIVFGHFSRSRIRRNPLLKGYGLATVGIGLGYLFLTVFAAGYLLLFADFDRVEHRSSKNGDVPILRTSEAKSTSGTDIQIHHPLLMTEFGEFKSEQSPWSIRVSARDRTLHFSRQPGSSGIGTSISPNEWRAQNGWFCYIEDENHAWAYDGDDSLMLVEVTPEKSTLYETETIQRTVPEVVHRLISQSTLRRVGAGRKESLDGGRTEIGGPEIGVLAAIWISGIDAGKYSQSCKDAAGFFQTAITEDGWVSKLEGMRKPLGAVKSREIREVKKANSLPGAPDGEYVIIQFDTAFASKAEAVETVTFKLEDDGLRKAAGYFIR